MKNNKFIMILSFFVLISIFIMSIGSSYAYYTKFDNSKNNKTTIKKINMLVKYGNNNKIVINNITPGMDMNYDFSIENFSEDTIGNYKITFEVITSLSNIVDNDFTYTITSQSNSRDASNILINKNETPIPIITKELGSATITPKNIHTYNLNIKYKKMKKKYDYLKNKMFVGQIKIENN